MGLFDFVTNAGEKLGGKVYEMLNDDEDITKPTSFSPERINEIRQQHITKTIEELDTPVDNLQVAVNGEQVTLNGSVADQASCEKVTLLAGNQAGITQVDCQIEVRKPEPEAVFYTVKSGDSLSKIAQAHYLQIK